MSSTDGQSEKLPRKTFHLDAYVEEKAVRCSLALFIAAGVVAVIPIYQIVLYFAAQQSGSLMFATWGTAMALVLAWGGLWIRFRDHVTERMELTVRESMRLMIIVVGGLTGFMIFLLGFALPLTEWRAFFFPAAAPITDFSKTFVQLWREHFWRLLFCELAFLGGLALMFVSFRLARIDERSRAGMRRLFHGYNAALSGLLLFNILFVINLLTFVPVPPFSWLNRNVDWTPDNLHTLSKSSVSIVKNLKKPVTVIVVTPGNNTDDLIRLAGNCRDANSSFDYRLVDMQRDLEAWPAVIRKFHVGTRDFAVPGRRGNLVALGGLIVTYGTEENAPFEVVRGLELSSSAPTTGEEQNNRFLFQGEVALMKALRRLDAGGQAKIYFTHGHGEPSLAVMRGDLESRRVISQLKAQLEQTGVYDVEALKLTPGKEIPNDAAVVVIAGPTRKLPPQLIAALQRYLKRNASKDVTAGRLLVMVSSETLDGKVVETGLEPLLDDYLIKVSDTRVLAARHPTRWREMPVDVPTVVAKEDSRNPIARALSRRVNRIAYPMRSPRTVRRRDPPRGQVMHVNVEVLMETTGDPTWEEADLTTEAHRIAAAHWRGTGYAPGLKLQETLPVAVAVSETSSPAAAAGAPGIGHETPKLVVFGDESWILDAEVGDTGGYQIADAVASCIAWLRGNPDVDVGVEAKSRGIFTLAGKAETLDLNRLYFLPSVLMLICILGLGGGIWIVRRR